MIGRARRRTTGGWWAAGAVLAAFVVVARTGTVDAPTQASETPIPGDSMIALETHVRALETALEVLQVELRAERDRATALESGYRTLEAQIEGVTLSTSGHVEASAQQGQSSARPAEATFVRHDQDR